MVILRRLFSSVTPVEHCFQDMEAHLRAYNERTALGTIEELSLTFEKSVKGSERGKVVYRDQVTMNFKGQAKEKDKTDMLGSLHSEAARFLSSRGYNAKSYNPVLSSRWIP